MVTLVAIMIATGVNAQTLTVLNYGCTVDRYLASKVDRVEFSPTGNNFVTLKKGDVVVAQFFHYAVFLIS